MSLANPNDLNLVGGHVRQGDVLVIRVDKMPSNVKTSQAPDNIVVEGEISGHNHILENGQVLLVAPGQDQIFRDRKREEVPHAYLKVKQETQLVHPQHPSHVIPKGEYEVRRQREVKGVVLD